MKKAIVTGSNGFVGSNLVDYLINNGVDVTTVDRVELNQNYDKKTNHIICSLQDMKKLPDLICHDDYDVFFHLAWEGSTGNKRGNYEIQSNNAVAVCNAAIASKKIGCKKFITPGTITEKVAESMLINNYTSDSIIYARAKIYAHNLLNTVAKKNNINYIWTVFSNLYGNNLNNGNLISYTFNKFESGEIPTYGPCLQPYNFTHIYDVINALYLLAETPDTENEYTISNGEVRELRDYILQIASMCNKEVAIGKNPDDGIVYNSEWFSNDKLVHSINFVPNYSFEKGISEIIKQKGIEL